jgi:integrase/recombinase XerD
MPQWRLSALPRYISGDDVKRLIGSCDLGKPVNSAFVVFLSKRGKQAGLSSPDAQDRLSSRRAVRDRGRYVKYWRPAMVGPSPLIQERRARPSETSNLDHGLHPYQSAIDVLDQLGLSGNMVGKW